MYQTEPGPGHNPMDKYRQAFFRRTRRAWRTWREDMLAEKKKGGDPSRAFRYQVAQMLNEVGGERMKTKDSGAKDITDIKPGMAVNLTSQAAITNLVRHKMV